jgi:hypothetical protein
MRPLSILLLLACLWGIPARGQITLQSGTVIRFATVDEAREKLRSRDDFIQRLSPFDRAARMKTDKEVSEKEFLEFTATNAAAWSEAEKQKLTTALQGLQAPFDSLALPLPKEVLLIKTTGREEGDAAYTRGNAIFLPQSKVNSATTRWQRLLAHECFHILSRTNPELREKLYAVIGFVSCDELPFPAELLPRKITNPDAPKNDHCIRLKLEGQDIWAVPILYATTERYDTAKGGEFFNYLKFQFLVVERQGTTVKPVYANGKPRLADMQQVTGFFEQVGRNTQYIIHPEEALADNFALLIQNDTSAPNPEIIQKLKAVLTGK